MKYGLDKYEQYVLDGIDKENVRKIVEFLIENKCDYIKELLSYYLDLFTFNYKDFIERFNKLNEKYNNDFINKAADNLNLFEEFYTI